MKGVFLVSALVLLLFIIPSAYAEQTVKTVEYPIGFVAQSVADQIYEKNITLTSPDGIAKIISSKIYVKGDFQANTDIKAYVETQTCSPSSWTSPNQDTSNYQTIFDCSDLTKDRTSGKYTLKFSTDKIAQNLYAYVKFTYYNYPKGSIGIMGTEYTIGESGTIFLQLTDTNGESEDNGICKLDVYNPDKTYWINNGVMIRTPNPDGIYYYDIFTKNETGVYMINAFCYYEISSKNETADNETKIYGVLNDGDYTNTWTDNGVSEKIYEEDNGTSWRFEWIWLYEDINYSSFGDYIPYEIDVIFDGQTTDQNEDFKIGIYNYSNSNWYWFTNKITYSTGDVTVSNYLPLNNFSDYIESGTLKIKIEDTIDDINAPPNKGYLHIDLLRVSLVYKPPIIQEVRGGGEIHVNDWFSNLTAHTTFTEGRYVSGTEYSPNELGQVSVQFMRTIAGNPSPINDGTCNVTVFYPNHTKFIDNQYAYYISGSNGIYAKNFTVPKTYGVYKIDFYCRKGGIRAYGSGSFHVSLWADTIFEINYTVGNISLKLENITELINNVNKSIHERINATNRSIWGKLYKIQDELFDINNNLTLIYNLIGDVNETIMNKLYLIQDEISSLNETLLDLSNVTFNITIQQEEILGTLIALWEDKAGIKQSYASFTGFLPVFGLGGFGGFEEIQYYCKDNITLTSIELINITGDINKTYFRVKEKTCTYGCVYNACILPPFSIWLFVIIVIVSMFILYEYFSRMGYI